MITENPTILCRCTDMKLLRTGQYVPCGRCYECILKNAIEIHLRIILEAEGYRHSVHATLTYFDSHYDNRSHSDKNMREIFRKDFDEFMKRLRKRYPNKKILSRTSVISVLENMKKIRDIIFISFFSDYPLRIRIKFNLVGRRVMPISNHWVIPPP